MVRLALALALVLVSASANAVSLAVSPQSIDTAYCGSVTATITGLNPGATVVLKHVLDLNGNGTKDPGEPVILAGTVTDGQVRGVAGVRNTNIPADDDSTVNGVIITSFPYPALEPTLCCIACKQLVQVSHPTSAFCVSAS